jgi:hypothetical protein
MRSSTTPTNPGCLTPRTGSSSCDLRGHSPGDGDRSPKKAIKTLRARRVVVKVASPGAQMVFLRWDPELTKLFIYLIANAALYLIIKHLSIEYYSYLPNVENRGLTRIHYINIGQIAYN